MDRDLLKTKYDIIGDVHGDYDKLIKLLEKLEYKRSNGSWDKDGHQAIFVGDLIDRGPRQIDTVALVRKMVENGSALCILGNHEFNAIAWLTPDPNHPNAFLRAHDKPGNKMQHKAFLDEVEGKPIHHEFIEWFKTLPLWLDLGVIRIVHACWNNGYMSQLLSDPDFHKGNTINDGLWIRSNKEGNQVFYALEGICKGLEVELPTGYHFLDREKQRRNKLRIKWWENNFSSYRNAALVPTEILLNIPDILMEEDSRITPYEGVPVFFGHYGLRGIPKLLGSNIACVDYSASPERILTAYQWSGEKVLDESNLVYV